MRVAKGLLGLLLMMPLLASAEEIGQVSTVFKFVGPNDASSSKRLMNQRSRV